MTALVSPEIASALIGLGGAIFGALVKSVYDSLNSESSRLQSLLAERDRELVLLRKALDLRHTDLSAYARTLEIVCLAYKLPLPEQVEVIRQARLGLEHALAGSGRGGGSG
jgi:hypothetical protein